MRKNNLIIALAGVMMFNVVSFKKPVHAENAWENLRADILMNGDTGHNSTPVVNYFDNLNVTTVLDVMPIKKTLEEFTTPLIGYMENVHVEGAINEINFEIRLSDNFDMNSFRPENITVQGAGRYQLNIYDVQGNTIRVSLGLRNAVEIDNFQKMSDVINSLNDEVRLEISNMKLKEKVQNREEINVQENITAHFFAVTNRENLGEDNGRTYDYTFRTEQTPDGLDKKLADTNPNDTTLSFTAIVNAPESNFPKVLTRWVDESDNPIKKSEYGDTEKPHGEVEGYEFLRTETLDNIVRHIFKKVYDKNLIIIRTKWVDQGGREIKPMVADVVEHEAGQIEGFTYERTERIENTVKHFFRSNPIKSVGNVITRWVDEKNNELKKSVSDFNEHIPAKINGYTFIRSERDKNTVSHVYRKNDSDGGIFIPSKPKQSTNTSVKNIQTMTDKAYIFGYLDNTFGAERQMTRAEVAVMFARTMALKNSNYIMNFNDVNSGAWYYYAVKLMSGNKIIEGYPNGNFNPNAPITRAEFTTMISRADKLIESEKTFSDVSKQHWAYRAIASAAQRGLVNGYPDGTFMPEQNITRAEAVRVTNRILGRSADKMFIDKNINSIPQFKDLSKNYWAYYDIIESAVGHEFTRQNGQDEVWIRLNIQK